MTSSKNCALVACISATQLLSGCCLFRSAADSSFKSDGDCRYSHLESLQRKAYEGDSAYPQFQSDHLEDVKTLERLLELTATASRVSEEERKAERERISALIRDLGDKTMATRFENPMVYFLLEDLVERASVSATRLGYPRPEFAWGTLPSREINAVALEEPLTRGRVVAFNTDLLAFFYGWLKTTVRVIPIDRDDRFVRIDTNPDRITSIVDDSDDAINDFVANVNAYVNRGVRPEVQLTNDHNILLLRLVRPAELFAVSHELAHVALGHLGTRKRFALSTATANESAAAKYADALVHPWADELQADYVGTLIAVDAIQGGDEEELPALAFEGPDIALSCMEAYDEVRSIIEGRVTLQSFDADIASEARNCLRRLPLYDCAMEATRRVGADDSSHPPYWLRRVFVREALNRQRVGELGIAEALRHASRTLTDRGAPSIRLLKNHSSPRISDSQAN